MAERRVVLTGLGTVNPLGRSVDEYWTGLVEGRLIRENVLPDHIEVAVGGLPHTPFAMILRLAPEMSHP